MRCFFSFALVLGLATQLQAFSPPSSAESMKAKLVTEQLDNAELTRLRLDAKRPIQMDAIGVFDLAKPDGASLVLTQKYSSQNQFSFYAYPKTAIRGGITQQSVADFIRRESENAIRRQEFFEVVSMPVEDGPTKIRYLGGKPLTAEYVIKRTVDGELQRMMVQDSWVELDDMVYRVRIEAQEDQFKNFQSECKSLANSMFFLD